MGRPAKENPAGSGNAPPFETDPTVLLNIRAVRAGQVELGASPYSARRASASRAA